VEVPSIDLMRFRTLGERALAIAALVLTMSAGAVLAEGAGPLEEIFVGVSGFANPNRNEFHDYWRAQSGVDLFVELPLRRGKIELGTQYSRVVSRTSGIPGYHSAFAYAGWGLQRHLAGPFYGQAGISAGLLWMVFDRPPQRPADSDENELGFAGTARLRWEIGSGWSATASARYRVVMTARRLEHVFVGVGIGRTFLTPVWLVEFLS
jgi:hypothetical protein